MAHPTHAPVLKSERDFAGRQSLGKRVNQEDAYAFAEFPGDPESAGGLLMVIADGMGGHNAGHEASALAVRTFLDAFHEGRGELGLRLSKALHAANVAIADAARSDPEELGGMGTTLLAVVATPAGLAWISVGDSPLYLFRAGQLLRINEDHSFRPILHAMVENGEITVEQAAHSALRNRLRAAVTGQDIAMVNASERPFPLIHGDLILAASDGLQSLSDEMLARTIEECVAAHSGETADRILDAILKLDKAKQDNATVAILKPPAAWLGIAPVS